MFQRPNVDTGVGPFIPEPIMEWKGCPRVTDVSGSKCSTGSTSDATLLVYEVG